MGWLSIRLDDDLRHLIKRVARARGVSVSDFTREAILRELARLSFLDEFEKKVLLGVYNERA